MESFAWTEIQQRLQNFVYRSVKDKAVAEDIVQDVFLKVHFKLGQLKETEKMTSWIFQITRNVIVDHFRRESKTLSANDLNWVSDHQALNDCVENCLQEMLLTLPEKYREALELAELKGLSQVDLAHKLNITYSGAKSRVQRARQLLKAKMEASYRIKMDNYGNVVVCENRVPCNCAPTF